MDFVASKNSNIIIHFLNDYNRFFLTLVLNDNETQL